MSITFKGADHEGATLGFYVNREAHYAAAAGDADSNCITVGMYYPNGDDSGGTTGEFSVAADKQIGSVQIRPWADAFDALLVMDKEVGLLAALRECEPTVEGVAACLLSLGFSDLTDRGDPKMTARQRLLSLVDGISEADAEKALAAIGGGR